MKNSILFLVLLLIVGCEASEIYFEQAQPANGKAEDIFPEALQGKFYLDSEYEDETDVILFISELIVESGDENGPIEHLCRLSDSLILKKYKSNYMLNLNNGDGTWFVMLISIQNMDKFAVHVIGGGREMNDDEIIKKLKKITKVEEEVYGNSKDSRYLINPGQKEFRKIVKEKIFTEAEIYIRVK